MSAAPLPGIVLGTLELPAPAESVSLVDGWPVRAADLAPGSWARRIAAPRARTGEPLTGLCDYRRRTLWVCVRQDNLNFAQALTHEVTHAVNPRVAGKRGEQWAEVCERVVGLLLRAGALRLTLRDRQIDAVRRQLLGAREAEPYETAGRLEPLPGGPWLRGLAQGAGVP